MEPIEIREAGLLIRPWLPGDVDAVYRACQDPDIQRWTTVPSPYRHQDAEGFVASHAPKAWQEETAAPFGVFDPATDELLGSCGFVSLRLGEREAEIGFWVAPWARGRAVAAGLPGPSRGGASTGWSRANRLWRPATTRHCGSRSRSACAVRAPCGRGLASG
jgi:hypothetical protein